MVGWVEVGRNQDYPNKSKFFDKSKFLEWGKEKEKVIRTTSLDKGTSSNVRCLDGSP